jgi:mTERF domain-containing protein
VDRWLKHNSVPYPKIGKLICMSKGKIESIRRVVQWLKSIRVKGEFLGAALTKSGGNILERSNEELDEIVDYLESNGVRMNWMGYVVSRCPQLLSYSMEEMRARVGFYLDMGMNEKDFGTMVFDYPRVLGYYTLEEMNEKVSESLLLCSFMILESYCIFFFFLLCTILLLKAMETWPVS